jgi:predicted esterase YcpF (UPF0227 family)
LILYLHGFRSSPRSFKARRLAGRLAVLDQSNDWRCPQLPVSPFEAIRLAESIIGDTPPASLALIGSSLGGFYATWLAQRYGCRAVVLNPATAPDQSLDQFLGEQTLWHSEGTVIVERRHLDELRALRVAAITAPERYYLIAATGDEVLDYQDMLQAYPGVMTTLIQGSDHGISDFDNYLDQVLTFCGVDVTQVDGSNGGRQLS